MKQFSKIRRRKHKSISMQHQQMPLYFPALVHPKGMPEMQEEVSENSEPNVQHVTP